MQGWVASTKSANGSTNTHYSAVFDSASGPIVGFDRMVIVGNDPENEIRALRYNLGFHPDGRVSLFMRLGPGNLDFYPSGALKKFSAELDDHTSCSASWDANA